MSFAWLAGFGDGARARVPDGGQMAVIAILLAINFKGLALGLGAIAVMGLIAYFDVNSR